MLRSNNRNEFGESRTPLRKHAVRAAPCGRPANRDPFKPGSLRRLLGPLVALFCLQIFLETSLGQLQVVKNPQAVQLLSSSVQALGGLQALASIRDSVSSGTLTVVRGSTQSAASVTIKTKGNNLVRTDVNEAGKVRVQIQRGDIGLLTVSGVTRRRPLHNSYNGHVEHIPIFSQLSEYGRQDYLVRYGGLVTVDGRTAHLIALVREDSDAASVQLRLSQFTDVEYLIDSVTLLPLRMRYWLWGDRNAMASILVENAYSDYRRVGAILVPFQMTRYIAGKQVESFRWSQVLLNQGVSDGEFQTP